MAVVRYERKPGDPLTPRQKDNLKQIAKIKNEDIDFSDIPELTEEWFARAVRGKFHRPLRTPMQDALSMKRKARR